MIWQRCNCYRQQPSCYESIGRWQLADVRPSGRVDRRRNKSSDGYAARNEVNLHNDNLIKYSSFEQRCNFMSKQMLRGIVMTTGRQTHQERWRHKGKWATGPIFNGRTNISGGKWAPSGGQSVQLQVSNSVTNRIGLHQSAVESVPHVSSGLIINSNRQLFALWWSTWLGNSHRSQLDWLFAASSQWPEFWLNFISAGKVGDGVLICYPPTAWCQRWA